MTDFTVTAAGTTKPISAEGGGGDCLVISNVYTPTTEILAGDRFLMARLPKGAVIVGGRVFGKNLDTTGAASALLDMDVGVDMGGTFDTDQLGNFGVWSSSAVANYKPETGYDMPLGGLLRTAGPQTMTGDYNNVYITVVASAAGYTEGNIGLELRYKIGSHS